MNKIKIIIPILFFCIFLFSSINTYASYYSKSKIIAEVVSKNVNNYELHEIAIKGLGYRGVYDKDFYSYYLFPKKISPLKLKENNTLPKNIKIGDLLMFTKKVYSNPMVGHGTRVTYNYMGLASEIYKKKRSKVLMNWKDGVTKEFYFKSKTPFKLTRNFKEHLQSDVIYNHENSLEIFIDIDEITYNDNYRLDIFKEGLGEKEGLKTKYNEEKIKKYFDESRFYVFIKNAPVEIKNIFRVLDKFYIGVIKKDGSFLKIKNVKDGILYGYIKGKIDRSFYEFTDLKPNEFKGIPYVINFEVPIK